MLLITSKRQKENYQKLTKDPSTWLPLISWRQSKMSSSKCKRNFDPSKKIRIADQSEFSWATIKAYESIDLANNSTDEKCMEKAKREAARCLMKKRNQQRQGGFTQDMAEAKRRDHKKAPKNSISIVYSDASGTNFGGYIVKHGPQVTCGQQSEWEAQQAQHGINSKPSSMSSSLLWPKVSTSLPITKMW